MRHENLRVRQIRRDFDRRHRDHPDARILDVQAEKIGELALDLVADAMRALGILFQLPLTLTLSPPAGRGYPSERSRHFDDFVHFELIALFDVVESFDRQSAFEPCLDLAHVILEALERIEFAIVDDDIVAQHPDLRPAPDKAFEHVAAGDGPDLGYLVYLAHFD